MEAPAAAVVPTQQLLEAALAALLAVGDAMAAVAAVLAVGAPAPVMAVAAVPGPLAIAATCTRVSSRSGRSGTEAYPICMAIMHRGWGVIRYRFCADLGHRRRAMRAEAYQTGGCVALQRASAVGSDIGLGNRLARVGTGGHVVLHMGIAIADA